MTNQTVFGNLLRSARDAKRAGNHTKWVRYRTAALALAQRASDVVVSPGLMDRLQQQVGANLQVKCTSCHEQLAPPRKPRYKGKFVNGEESIRLMRRGRIRAAAGLTQ